MASSNPVTRAPSFLWHRAGRPPGPGSCPHYTSSSCELWEQMHCSHRTDCPSPRPLSRKATYRGLPAARLKAVWQRKVPGNGGKAKEVLNMAPAPSFQYYHRSGAEHWKHRPEVNTTIWGRWKVLGQSETSHQWEEQVKARLWQAKKSGISSVRSREQSRLWEGAERDQGRSNCRWGGRSAGTLRLSPTEVTHREI